VTSGGRVFMVTAISNSIHGAMESVYKNINKIQFEGIYYRKDIALKAADENIKLKTMTYKDSGVNIDVADSIVDSISPLAKGTARNGTDALLGGFGGLFDLKAAGYKDPILVSGTDGVGTKLLIAHAISKHDTIGIDLVAMSVNDILVQGAEPLFFLDYFATGKLNADITKSVIQGIATACKESNCALIGGETAEMPGMYDTGKYDLAGFAVGAVERTNLLPKEVIVDDIILGLPSSGIHSNGFSLVRNLVELYKLSFHEPAPFDTTKSLGEALLEPTKLYVKSCLPLIQKGVVKAMAHITGGGITENLPRVISDKIACEIDLSSWKLPLVFKWIAGIGNIERDELIRTFNCGIGMILIVSKENMATCIQMLGSEEWIELGRIVPRSSEAVVFINEWKE